MLELVVLEVLLTTKLVSSWRRGTITHHKRDKKAASLSPTKTNTQFEQWTLDLRRRRDFQVTGKLKPTQSRNLPRLIQILKDEGFQIRGHKLVIRREEATFEIDLKMGHVYASRESQEPIILCVTSNSPPWVDNEELSDFDVFLLSVIYQLANEKIPESITNQLDT